MSADYEIASFLGGTLLLGAAVAALPVIGASYAVYKGITAGRRQAEKRRLREQEEKRIQEQLRQKQREANYSRMLELRREYQGAVSRYEQSAAGLEARLGEQMDGLNRDFERQMKALDAGGAALFEEKFERDKQSLLRDFEERRQRLERSFQAELNTAFNGISQSFNRAAEELDSFSRAQKEDGRKAEIAAGMLEQAHCALELYRAEAGSVSGRIERELESAHQYYGQKDYDMAYGKASGVALECLGRLEETKKQQQEFFRMADEISDKLFLIEERLSKMRNVEFPYNGERMREDLTRFEPGLFGAVETRLTELKEQLEAVGGFHRSKTADLRRLSAQCTSLDEDVLNVTKYAAAKMAFAYSENDQAELVTDVLEEQGFRMADYAYEGDLEGNVMHINYENDVTHEKLTVLLTPGEHGVQMSVHNFGRGGRTAGDKYSQQAVQQAIERRLGRKGVCRNLGGVSQNFEAADLEAARRTVPKTSAAAKN